MAISKVSFSKILPFVLLIGGVIGFLASFILSVEKYELLKNPHYQPSCNLNPLFSCVSVANTPQAAVFGFPNMLLGIGAFAMVITVGVALCAGAQFKPWFWRLFNLGTLFGIVFIHWLFVQSVYFIGALCIYCMVVWSVMAPTFWYTTLYSIEQGTVPVPERLKGFANGLLKYHDVILASWYVLIIFLILQHFWSFFGTLL